jgi:soluble lytic murein transglycosylase-like protein
MAEGSDGLAGMANMMSKFHGAEKADPETTGSLGKAPSVSSREKASGASASGLSAASITKSANGALGFEAHKRSRFTDLIARHAQENGVPFALADAVVRIESRYNPDVSNAGAVGLMQIKTQTARGLGYDGGAAGLKHPETNIRYGMKYLGQAYRMASGDTCGTVMRYQSGHYATRLNGANLTYCSKARSIMGSKVASN